MAQAYTVKQVAEILGYCTNSIYGFIKQGRLKGIRLGKGRFLIPQEEIDRLLPKPATSLPEVTQKVSELEFGPLKIPSLFDWLVGIASVTLGVSLLLFNKIYESIALSPYHLIWFFPLKISLVTAGLGLLLADFAGKKYIIWQKFFRFFLFLAYSVIAIVWGLAGDFLGTTIWGTLAFILFLRFFTKISGVKSLILYIFLLAITLPACLLFPQTSILPEWLKFLSSRPTISTAATVVVVLISALILKWIHQRNKFVSWLLFSPYLVFLLIISLWSAQNVSWEKALFLLLVVLVSFFAPWWEAFQFSLHRDRLVILTAFSIIIAFFLSLIGIILVIQRNTLEYTQNQLVDKTAYGQLVVSQALGSIKNTLENSATNPLLISQLLAKERTEKDEELLANLIRSLMEGNQNLRRIIILDKTGEVVVHYPYDITIEGKNFAYRDYFKQALTSKKIYISDVFESVLKKPTVVLSFAVMDKEKNVIGVLVGSLDLDLLNNNLQQIATRKCGEYFLLIDEGSNYIIHPKADLVGTSAVGNNFQPVRILQAASKVDEKNWIIIAQAPISSTLAPNHTTLCTIYFVAGLGVIAILLLLLIMYPKVVKQIDGL